MILTWSRNGPEMRFKMLHPQITWPIPQIALQVLGILTSCYPHPSLQHHSQIKFSKLQRPEIPSSKAQLVQGWNQDEGSWKSQRTLLSSAAVCQGQYCQLISHPKAFPCLIPIGFLPTYFYSDWLHTSSPPPTQKYLSDPVPGNLEFVNAQAVYTHNCFNWFSLPDIIAEMVIHCVGRRPSYMFF